MLKFRSEERWLTPFSFTIIVATMVYGLVLIVSSGNANWEPSPATIDASPLVHLIEGIIMFAGALFIILGEREWQKLNIGWTFERSGSLLLFIGWIMDAAIVFMQDWTHTSSLLVSVTMAIAILTRYVQVNDAENRVRRRVARLWKAGFRLLQ